MSVADRRAHFRALHERDQLFVMPNPWDTGSVRLLASCGSGYAEASGEREPGLTAIAAPIRSARGELEAIVALQGPSSRFDPAAVEAALPLVLERAEAISRELGWRPT